MMLLIISFFSVSQMRVRRRLPYIVKDDSSEGLQNSLTNKELILDRWISELGSAVLPSVL